VFFGAGIMQTPCNHGYHDGAPRVVAIIKEQLKEQKETVFTK
jgi:hypothetical protein